MDVGCKRRAETRAVKPARERYEDKGRKIVTQSEKIVKVRSDRFTACYFIHELLRIFFRED